jgi:hypothetical protein
MHGLAGCRENTENGQIDAHAAPLPTRQDLIRALELGNGAHPDAEPPRWTPAAGNAKVDVIVSRGRKR